MDAIASCRILQYLLLCDSISYSIVPVQNQNDLISAYKESCEQVKLHVLLIDSFISKQDFDYHSQTTLF